MPSYHDPLGQYDHLVPVPMGQAIKELQIAEAKVDHLRTAVNEATKHVNQLRGKLVSADNEVGEKQYLVLLSARHSFIPPTPSPAT